MFEIKEKTKLKLSIYGQEYEISKPTYGQTSLLQEKLKGDGEKNSMSVMKEFVSELGLPTEVIDAMELDHFLALVEHISGSKKK